MKMKKLFPYILGGIALLGLNSCGNQTQKPKVEPSIEQINVIEEYQGPQMPNDFTKVSLEGKGLENCVLEVNNSHTTVSKPFNSESVNLYFGNELFEGDNTLTAKCNNDALTKSTTLSLEAAKIQYTTTNSDPNDKNKIVGWDPVNEISSTTVTASTNLPNSRITGWEITFSYDQNVKDAVDAAFNRRPNNYLSSQKPDLSDVVSNNNVLNINNELPGGSGALTIKLHSQNSLGTTVLEETYNLSFEPGAVKLFGVEKNGTTIVRDNGPKDTDSRVGYVLFPYVVINTFGGTMRIVITENGAVVDDKIFLYENNTPYLSTSGRGVVSDRATTVDVSITSQGKQGVDETITYTLEIQF